MNILANETLKEMIEGIKEGKITIIRNPDGSVKGIGINRSDLKVSDVRYVKTIGCGQVVGRTLEEMQADEEALRAFAASHNSYEYMELASVAETLSKLSDEEVRALASYIERHQEVKVVERKVEVPARAVESSSRYPALLENLHSLDIETLKEMKRQATRNGASDLKNACRTVLRHKGVNC